MAASAPLHNILGEGCVDSEQWRPAGVPVRTHLLAGALLCPQPCIRGQWGYLEGVMIKLVKNLRLLVHGGCLKAGQ